MAKPGLIQICATGAAVLSATVTIAAKAPGKPISVVDDLGQRIVLAKPATRLVVIEPSNAEIALDLGLKKKIVGVDASSFQYAPKPWRGELHGLHSIGTSYPSVSQEAIVATRPDLVISGTGVAGLKGLARFHIPVLYLDPTSIQGVYHDVILVGKLTGRLKRAQAEVVKLKSEVHAIHQLVVARAKTHPSVFFDLGGLYSAGPRSFINGLIQLAGARNVVDRFSQKAYPKVTAEQVVRANPDIILVDPEGTTVAKERALAGFSAIRAVVHHRVYALPQPSYVDQPSPGLVLGLKEFVRFFHPHLHLPS